MRAPPGKRLALLAIAAVVTAAAVAVLLVLLLGGGDVGAEAEPEVEARTEVEPEAEPEVESKAEPEAGPAGPLVSASVAQGSGFPVDAGAGLTYAGVVLVNPGPEPAVLEALALVEADPGIRVVGVLAAPSPEGAFVHAYREFPPDPAAYRGGVAGYPELAPLAGYVVSPRRVAGAETPPTQLYVGLESAEARGRVALGSFEVSYRVGERRFALVVPHSVALCTPRAEWYLKKRCPTFLPEEGA